MRVYTTGAEPSNPIYHERYVFIISDVREEQTPEDYTGDKIWSYNILKEMTYPEYIESLESTLKENEEANNLLLLSVDSDICNIYDLIEGK